MFTEWVLACSDTSQQARRTEHMWMSRTFWWLHDYPRNHKRTFILLLLPFTAWMWSQHITDFSWVQPVVLLRAWKAVTGRHHHAPRPRKAWECREPWQSRARAQWGCNTTQAAGHGPRPGAIPDGAARLRLELSRLPGTKGLVPCQN